jgi:hypothetical protein
MRLKRPSPSMMVACIALFVALGGTSIAAVNYARNAGQVDGKNAYKAFRGKAKVAGDLVATKSSGEHAGQIPNRFLANTPHGDSFGALLDVADNAAGASTPLADTALGTLSAACNDQDTRANREDPVTTVSIVNDTAQGVNVSRRVGVNPGTFSVAQTGQTTSVQIRGSNTFSFVLESFGTVVQVEGLVRQDGADTAAAQCLVVGSAQTTR